MKKQKTQLKKLSIEKFRALNGVEIEFGECVTVICGKNGTSKSSILGIAAQIFSFERDYVKDEAINFRQITGAPFKSKYSEHFRISKKFDQSGSMSVSIELYDGYTDQSASAKLELMKRGVLPRPVVRNNSTVEKGGNTSRNFTHPVIFLSLKRLYPIAERKYKVKDFQYLNSHKQDFIGLFNELLNRQSSQATGTGGTISSAVAHGDNYDQESVSAGEDNAGQIVLALMSFRKLKEEYTDYKGGLLLIDEADAGLFPTAQENLLRILDRECKDLNIQVVMTSHSPTLIEYAYRQSQKYRRKYKVIYLSDTYGKVKVMQDWPWARIYADIHTQTISSREGEKLPKINVYFEDKEAADFFAALMYHQPINKFTAPMTGVSIGCSNYLHLIDKGVPEFSERSIVCLDPDTALQVNKKERKTVVILPGELPPDQLIFEHLYNLPADDGFWENELMFTRQTFTNNCAQDVMRELGISGDNVDVRAKIEAYQGDKVVREIFKRFYKTDDFQKLVRLASKPYNPWRHWIVNNQDACSRFLERFVSALRNIMSSSAYAVDAGKLTALQVKLKGN